MFFEKLKRVELHPETLKYLAKGHPWVTADQKSRAFPANEDLLIALNGRGDEVAMLLHDPKHETIKARVWAWATPTEDLRYFWRNFNRVFAERLESAISQRLNQDFVKTRENFYLCFGEIDQLPGFMIQKLGHHILIQFYSHFWKRREKKIVELSSKIIRARWGASAADLSFWVQWRGNGEVGAGGKRVHWPKVVIEGRSMQAPLSVKEFGLSYQLLLGESYDVGIYTDMAATRALMQEQNLFAGKRVLNLFCYTGAFSTWALKCGASEVTSVDISKSYLDILQKNLETNQLASERHHSVQASVKEYVKQAVANHAQFDLIICDPPTFSHDGRGEIWQGRQISGLAKDLLKLITPSKGAMVLFNNSHQTSPHQWKKSMVQLMEEQSVQSAKPGRFAVTATYGLAQDCPTCKNFPEGNYLKGVLIQVKE